MREKQITPRGAHPAAREEAPVLEITFTAGVLLLFLAALVLGLL